jgi:hypothetical protein
MVGYCKVAYQMGRAEYDSNRFNRRHHPDDLPQRKGDHKTLFRIRQKAGVDVNEVLSDRFNAMLLGSYDQGLLEEHEARAVSKDQ